MNIPANISGSELNIYFLDTSIMDEWVKIEYNLNDIITFDNLDELLKI